MKIKSLFMLACLVTISGYAQVKKAGLTIHGILPASFNNHKIYLDSSTVYLNMHSSVHIDSGMVMDGRFDFFHRMNEPAELLILLSQKNADGKISYGSKAFFAGKNDQISFTQKSIAAAQGNLLESAVISGSKYNAQYEEMMHYTNSDLSPKDKLMAARAGHTKSADTLKMVVAIFSAWQQKNADLLTEFINKHPNYYISLYKFREQLGRRVTNVPEAMARYKHFTPLLQNSILGKQTLGFIDSSSKLTIGQMAPDFAALTPDGKTVKLTDLRGKYVLLDFWASWCGPCRAENPNLVKAYSRFKDKNFEILSFSLDEGHNPWVKAIKDDHVGWMQVSDLKGWKSSMVKSYLIPSVPSNFLIDPQGKIIAINLRGPMVEKELEKTL